MSLKAVSLYNVRNDLDLDYAGTIEKLAAMGYEGVEAVRKYGPGAKKVSRLFAANNLQVISCHIDMPVGEHKNFILDTAQALGVKYLVCGYRKEEWDSIEKIKKIAENFSVGAANAAVRGMKLACHNHYWEMRLFDGVPAYRIFLENVSSDVLFEIDTYWVRVAGLDPVEVVNELKLRAPLIHLKDGKNAKGKGAPFTALNEGIMDMDTVIENSRYAEALIVEQDWHCGNTTMLEDAERSIKYLNKVL